MMRRISMVARDELVAAVTDRYARGDRGERGRILASLRRYRGLLGYTNDGQAIAAIEQLIRETRNRLDRLKTRDIARCEGSTRFARCRKEDRGNPPNAVYQLAASTVG
jgi:hypothetical protein